MSTVKSTNLQHPDAASPNIVLAADGTVAGLRSTQNTQTGVTYTLALTDIGSLSTFDNASPITVTLPEQATVEWPASSSTSLLTLGAGTVTLSWPAGVTVNGLASGNTSLTLATSKGGSLVRTASNVWTFIPFFGGVGNADFSNTATGTYTDSEGVSYKYIKFSSPGTLNITEGIADVLVVAGGGNSGSGSGYGSGGGGGGGGVVYQTILLSSGALPVTVGSGGTPGGDSSLSTIVGAIGGGGGGLGHAGSLAAGSGYIGGNGGGGGNAWTQAGTSPGGLGMMFGYPGGSGATNATQWRNSGGGGGAGGAGANGSNVSIGNGGPGYLSSITGVEVSYGYGGGGATGDDGTGASGGHAGVAGTGGGGSGNGSNTIFTGGSGAVIVRVVV